MTHFAIYQRTAATTRRLLTGKQQHGWIKESWTYRAALS